MAYPTGELHTKLGTITYSVTGQNRVVFHTPFVAGEPQQILTVNKLRYFVNMVAVCNENGQWEPGENLTLVVREIDPQKKPSKRTIRVVQDALLAAWADLVEQVPSLRKSGERARLNKEIKAIQKEIDAKRQELASLEETWQAKYTQWQHLAEEPTHAPQG
jgi:flagellar motility protein MotE (MotC chaperone)